jgi:hypothetical protein
MSYKVIDYALMNHINKDYELTDALGLTRSRFIEDRAPAALLSQISATLKKIEASSIG